MSLAHAEAERNTRNVVVRLVGSKHDLWLISNLGTATAPLRWDAVIAVVALTVGIVVLHRRIKHHIESLREL